MCTLIMVEMLQFEKLFGLQKVFFFLIEIQPSVAESFQQVEKSQQIISVRRIVLRMNTEYENTIISFAIGTFLLSRTGYKSPSAF